MQIDHVLIAVSGLAAAVEDFSRAGFKVYYGTRADKAYNAMVYFKDGTFIELVDVARFPKFIGWLHALKLTRLFGVMGERVARYATCGQPILDIGLHTPAIALDWQRLQLTMPVSRRYNLKRIDVNGTRLTWQLFAPKDVLLPFVMSAYHPSRLPAPDAVLHPNGVIGLHQVRYGIERVASAAYVGALSAMLDVAPEQGDEDDVVFMLPEYSLVISATRASHVVLRGSDALAVEHTLNRYGISVVVASERDDG
jgi:hypothetical protein